MLNCNTAFVNVNPAALWLESTLCLHVSLADAGNETV